MLKQRGYIRAAVVIALVCGAVLLETHALISLAAAGEVVFRIGGDIEGPSNGRWTIWQHCRDVRSVPVTVMAPRQPSQGLHWSIFYVRVGVPLGAELRGSNMAMYLLVEAADDYRVVFALPELDPAFTERVILLADRRDGQPLAAAEGPLRLVVPDEKRHARWVRQVRSCTVRRAP